MSSKAATLSNSPNYAELIAEALRASYNDISEPISESGPPSEPSELESLSVLEFVLLWIVAAANKLGVVLDDKTIITLIFSLALHLHALDISEQDFVELGQRFDAIEQQISTLELSNRDTVLRTVADLNLRSEPSVEGEIVFTMPEGVEVVMIRSEGGWSYVKFFDSVSGEELYGWCRQDYVQIENR